MKCPNCKASLEGNPHFCPYCGENISEIKKEEKRPKNKKVIKWLFIILIPLAILFILFMFLSNQNTKYELAIDNGIEAINDKDYEQAIGYFEQALDEKKEDEMAQKLSQDTAILQDAESFYVNEEFDQSLNKVNVLLDTKTDEKEFKGIFKNAEELKIKVQNIYEDQNKFEADYKQAKNLFENSNADEKEIEEISVILKKILAHEKINESYHQGVKENTESLVYEVEAYEAEQKEIKVIQKEEEEQKKQEELKAKEEQKELETIEENKKDKLDQYSAKEIEYARIILMAGYPGSPTVNIHISPAGTAVASGYEETIKYPEETITLTGEYGADGMVKYTSLGGGNIRVYPAPSHWHQDDQSPEGYREYSQEILDGAEDIYIEPGDTDQLLKKLRTTEFINQ